MRLSNEQQAVIKQLTQQVFGGNAQVRLFGSRLDDQVRGGDIDLLVYSEQPIPNGFHKGLQLTAKLQMALGDQPIDVLVIDPDTALNPIHKHALATGKPL